MGFVVFMLLESGNATKLRVRDDDDESDAQRAIDEAERDISYQLKKAEAEENTAEKEEAEKKEVKQEVKKEKKEVV